MTGCLTAQLQVLCKGALAAGWYGGGYSGYYPDEYRGYGYGYRYGSDVYDGYSS